MDSMISLLVTVSISYTYTVSEGDDHEKKAAVPAEGKPV